ncbi:MAG: hypothetical protein HYZ44_18060, partial [Bacteroidetes bacterium]|nr:hypothetical protein [Bacteroidota bacterium]
IPTSTVHTTGATSGQALTDDGPNVVWGNPAVSGTAGGDLSGTYPNPIITSNAITTIKIADNSITTSKVNDGSITTSKVNTTGATNGQALTYDGTNAVWGSPAVNGTAGGDLSGTYPNPTIAANAITTVKIADNSVTTSKVNTTGATSGQALTYNGTNVVWGNPAVSGTAGGDLSGTYPNPSVAANAITTSKIADNSITTPKVNDGSITTSKVNTTGATSGQALTFDGTNVVWGSPSPSGTAGGDLSGTYPNPTISSDAITTSKILDGNVTTSKLADNSITTSKINDGSITTSKLNATGATSGQALTFDGTNAVWGSPAVSGTAGGDLSGTYPNPTIAANAITTVKIADNSVTTSKVNTIGATSGQALTYNGTNVVWGNPSPSGTAGGDLSGTYPNPSVAANAITTSKIADNSITTPKVNDGSIT